MPIRIAAMQTLERRRFLQFAGLPALLSARLLRAATEAGAGKLRVSDLEIHEVFPPFCDYNARQLLRYAGLQSQARAVYVLRVGSLEGYGEAWARAPKRDSLARYVGADILDCLTQTENMPISMAALDLLGKHLEVPAWRLLGPKIRNWVPVGFWTVSQHPDAMAEEVRQAARRGYRWLKYHVNVTQNAVEQTAAMAKVAPPGFKVHYDFNADSDVESVYPVMRDLEAFAIAGRIEDPIAVEEQEGWRVLRQKSRLTVLFHHNPGPTEAALLGRLCDGFVASRWPLGVNRHFAALAETTNTPFVLQMPGGNLSQAFMAHQAAAFKMASLDAVTVSNLWSDDITAEAMPVLGGSIEVPDRPGLGVTLDRAKLERYTRVPQPDYGRFLVRVRYTNGPAVYFRHNPDAPGASMGLARHRGGADFPGPVPGYGNAVVTDFWDQEGSAEFEAMWRRTEAGPVWTDRPAR